MTAHHERHESATRAGCPVCALFATVEGAHPEATEHLVNAGRELIGAARAFLDAAESALDEQYGSTSESSPADRSESADMPSAAAAHDPVRLRRIRIS